MENKSCRKCQNSFTIERDDFSFYTKMGVQAPDLCPQCRAQLRHIFRNERNFYKRNCDLCGESIITIWSPNKDTPIYCVNCWWSDKWNPKDYALEYNENIDFFKQVGELYKNVPKPALVGMRNIDSNYVNYAADCNRCYMIVESSNNEDCTHCYWIQLSKDLIDCSFTNKVERSYEVDDCYDSYGLLYSKGCYSCTDSYFLLNCRGCTDCIGCINLRQQKYCIFNTQYTKNEYEKIKEELRLDTHSGVEDFRNKYNEFVKNQPRKFAELTQTVDSTGNYLNNVKNNRHCFHSYDAKDNAYSCHVWREAKDCYDCHTAGRTAEKIYNSTNTGIQASNCICCHNCWSSNFTEYSFNCPNGNNLFGCMAIKKGSYCLLNKDYTKEDYDQLRNKIIENLKKDNKYGEFFPKEIMLFGYNETTAMEEFPFTKEEALAQGFKWEDTPRGTYGKETKKWDEIPDSVNDINFDVAKEIFVCTQCEKNYKIIENEFIFYKKLSIPLPRLCPDCRHTRRFVARGPNKLWHRSCMKEGCNNEFETSYDPERPEIIYCESCYQQEVL